MKRKDELALSGATRGGRGRIGGGARLSERLAERAVMAVALLTVAAIIVIFVFILREAVPVFYDEFAVEEAPLSNLFGRVWQPVSEEPKFGLQPLLLGTLKVTLIAILISAPLGILAAIYISFFAPRWLREFLKPATEILAGFPSVVVGFFALVVLATYLQKVTGSDYRLNAVLGGVGLSFAVIPIIFSLAEDALASVPKEYYEASLALGASRWETAIRVVVPAAYSGIVAGVILGIGRAIGETMIALMATGNAALLSPSFLDPTRTMAATIGSEMGEVVFGDTHYFVLFLIGTILFVITFGINLFADVYQRYLLRKIRGGSR